MRARSLRSAEAIEFRRGMLGQPHVAPLRDYVAGLRAEYPACEFPDFDPLDGGCLADILFLFEKPGPKTSRRRGGSGFISRDNDDPTAEETLAFMEEAKLPRKRTVIWNVVPGWNGTRAVTAGELTEGIERLKGLLPLFNDGLKTIVLVGCRAGKAEALLKPTGIRLLVSAHPSPIVRGTRPEMWRTIPRTWETAA